MNINKAFKVESISKDDLIVWFRKNISNKLHTIEELGNGGEFLLAMEMLIPGSVALEKVKFKKTTESDRLRNFRTLRKIFHKLGIDKDIEAEKMVRGLFKENYHFALWFRAFFKTNYKGNNKYPLNPANPLNQKQRTKAGLVNEEQDESGVIKCRDDFPEINPNGRINDSTSISRNVKESEKENATGIQKKDPNFDKKFRDVTKYCSVKNTSKQDLIRWFRSTLSPTLHSIEELGTGADFCLGLEVLFPGSIPIHHIRFTKTTENERIANFRVLGRALDELGVKREICDERLAKGIFKDNFQFAQWFKAFFMSNYRGQAYDINEIRAAKKKKSRPRLDFPNDRISTKEILSENIGQGDAFGRDSFGQTTSKGEMGLPEVGNNLSQEAKVDVASQTDQPLPSVSRGMLSSVEDLDNQEKLLRIRCACDDLPHNELSQIILRLLDGDNDGDVFDDEEEEDEEEEIDDEEVEEYGEREKEIRSYSGQLLPAL